MTDETAPKQPYKWLSNLYCPFDTVDAAYLEKLGDYKIGVPRVAKGRDTALTLQELTDFNIVGIYTTAKAFRQRDPDKITADMARKALKEPWEPLTSHLASYLDEDAHFVGRQ
jgi:hypothetical protein